MSLCVRGAARLHKDCASYERDSDMIIDVHQYGFNGISDQRSTFRDYQLNAPTLNISAVWFTDDTLFGFSESEFNGTPSNEELKKSVWVWSNDTYDAGYLAQNGTCQASGVWELSEIDSGTIC
jgi:hypothetical protein